MKILFSELCLNKALSEKLKRLLFLQLLNFADEIFPSHTRLSDSVLSRGGRDDEWRHSSLFYLLG